MPQVPYGQPRVAPTPIPGVQSTGAETPDSLGAGVFRQRERADLAWSGVAGEAGRVVSEASLNLQRQAQQRAKDYAFMGGTNQVTSTMNEWQKSAYLKTGTDSYGLPDEMHALLTKTADDASKNFTDPDLKLAWAKWVAQQRDSLDVSINRHVVDQTKVVEDQTIGALKQNTVDTAALQNADVGKVGDALQTAEAGLARAGAWDGKPQVVKDSELLDLRTKAWSAAIQGALDNKDPAQAQRLFDFATQNNQFHGQLQQGVQQQISKASDDKAALDKANSIIASSTDPEARLAAVKLITDDPTLHDAVYNRVKQQNADDEQAKQQGTRNDIETAYQILNNPKTFGNIDAVPFTLQQKIATTMPSLRAYAESLKRGVPIQMDSSNFGAWQKLHAEMTDTDATKFMGEQLKSYLGVLPTDVVMRFQEQQDAMRQNKPVSAEVLNARMEDAQFNVLAYQLAGLPTFAAAADLKPDDKERIARTRYAVDEALQQAQVAAKGVLTLPQKEDVMRAVISRQVTLPGGMWSYGLGTQVPLTTVLRTEQGTAYVPVANIPQPSMAAILAKIRRLDVAQVKATDDQVVAKFKDRIQRAYAARLFNATNDDIDAILSGRK